MDSGQLIRLGQAYAAHARLELSTVSTYSANDGKWFARLQGGATCTLRKAVVVFQWFADHWPADLEWPADIPRPTPNKEAA